MGETQRRPFESAAARHRLASRRKKYFRRRVAALIILLGILAGLFYSVRWLVAKVSQRPEQGTVQTSSLPFTPAKFLKVTLDGAQTEAYLAISSAESALRQIGLVIGPQKSPKLVGKTITVAGFDLAVVDLPQAKGVVVLYQMLPAEGTARQVQVGSAQALEAAGGEPDYQAWTVDKSRGLVPTDYRMLAAPLTPPAPTAIVVDKWLNSLWFYENGKLSATFRVATGVQIHGPNPTAATAQANRLTPLGKFAIATRDPGRPYYRENIPARDPKNPLGTRWLGFSVYPNDGGNVWAIHGTNEPDLLGRWISDGCIRMDNRDVEWLYDRVQVGTPLEIVSSEPKL